MPAEHSTQLNIRNPKLRRHRNHCAFLCACSLSKTHIPSLPGSQGPYGEAILRSRSAPGGRFWRASAPAGPAPTPRLSGGAAPAARLFTGPPAVCGGSATAPQMLGLGILWEFTSKFREKYGENIYETCGFKP